VTSDPDDPDPDTPAAERWRRLVAGRLDEMERLRPGGGAVGAAFWDSRAERFAASVNTGRTEGDPFLRRLRRVMGPSSTAIDVGAGTGRFALALAAGVGHVTAIDPSKAMLSILRREAREKGVQNLITILGTWDEADVEVADVAFSSFVLPLVQDARSFLKKLDESARGHVFLYLGAYSGDAVLDPLWRHFHGAPRAPGASYLDAVAVLRELGIEPKVKLVEIANRKRFATVDAAVEHYRDGLMLRDLPEVKVELEGLLGMWLLGREGAFRSPLRSAPVAIIHWRPHRGSEPSEPLRATSARSPRPEHEECTRGQCG
jgi:SAM-dependent methyltransferase